MDRKTYGVSETVYYASVNGVEDRWNQQYPPHDQAPHYARHRETGLRIAQAMASDSPPTPDNLAEIIGNKSWTHPVCVGCFKPKLKVVAVNTLEPHENNALCLKCLVSKLEVAKLD